MLADRDMEVAIVSRVEEQMSQRRRLPDDYTSRWLTKAQIALCGQEGNFDRHAAL
jgi:hypothetical protein